MKETIKAALLGGDNRELILLSALIDKGYEVRCYGQPAELLPTGIAPSKTLREALQGVNFLILPMAGVSAGGMVFNAFGILLKLSSEDLCLMAKNSAVITGIANSYLKEICKETATTLITTAETDAIAIPNSIPTAEGAISLAIKNSGETLNGSKSLIIGYGRVGQALACRLRALGSDTEITNRGEVLRKKAEQDGFMLLKWDGFENNLSVYDYIFNTVPAPILTVKGLKSVKKEALLMDLASLPGGIDFNAALNLGLNVMQALSLPGKFSPVSAGKILAAVYPQIMEEFKLKGEYSHE